MLYYCRRVAPPGGGVLGRRSGPGNPEAAAIRIPIDAKCAHAERTPAGRYNPAIFCSSGMQSSDETTRADIALLDPIVARDERAVAEAGPHALASAVRFDSPYSSAIAARPRGLEEVFVLVWDVGRKPTSASGCWWHGWSNT